MSSTYYNFVPHSVSFPDKTSLLDKHLDILNKKHGLSTTHLRLRYLGVLEEHMEKFGMLKNLKAY